MRAIKRFRKRLAIFWSKLSFDQRGITTSEFWLSGITIISTVTGLLTGHKAGVVSAVVAAYAISRGLKKVNTTPKT